MLGGLFAYAIGQWEVQPGLHLYQYIYITYGAFTTGWGIMLFFALPDSPVTAWFLNHEERLAAVARVQQNQTGMINRHFKRDQVIEAILDPKTWFFFVFGFVSNIVNGGLNAFSTAIINGFGFSTFYKSFFGHYHLFINFNAFLCLSDFFFSDALDTTLLSVPWGFVATVSNIIIGLCISYTTGKRLLFMSAVILIPMVGTIIQFCLSGPRGGLLVGYYLTGAYNVPYVMMLALITSNTAGTTKKVITNAIVWVAYCGGMFILKTNP